MNSCDEEYKKFSKEFFDTLDEKLKIAKGQFEICDRCKQNTISELEKLRSEIMATGNWKSEYEISDRGVIKAVEVIDNHISELKGENKEIRCNTCIHNTIFREAKELMFGSECYACVKGIEDWYEPISELKGENNE